MNADEDLVHAKPQKLGNAAHESIDKKKYSSKKDEITSLSVFSNELGIMGKIDLYRQTEKTLIERKYKLDNIYQGQIYQLWAQFFCMLEMGYKVEKLIFYATSSNKTYPIENPNQQDKMELMNFIKKFKNFNPAEPIKININKCKHCIYCNLCDKIEIENVYT